MGKRVIKVKNFLNQFLQTKTSVLKQLTQPKRYVFCKLQNTNDVIPFNTMHTCIKSFFQNSQQTIVILLYSSFLIPFVGYLHRGPQPQCESNSSPSGLHRY